MEKTFNNISLFESNMYNVSLLSNEMNSALVEHDDYYPTFISEDKDSLFEKLGLPTISTGNSQSEKAETILKNKLDTVQSNSYYFEEVKFQQWKMVENISAKLLYINANTVTLECLIDKEEKIYEERELKISLFKNFELKIGSFFKLCLFERDNGMMMEVKDGSKLVLENEFPTFDFYARFGSMKLSNKL